MEKLSCEFRGYTIPTKTHVCMDKESPFFHCQVNEDHCKKCMSESRGLGDTVAKIAQATGVRRLVKGASELIGVPCGCEERQEQLNKLFPYNNK